MRVKVEGSWVFGGIRGLGRLVSDGEAAAREREQDIVCVRERESARERESEIECA